MGSRARSPASVGYGQCGHRLEVTPLRLQGLHHQVARRTRGSGAGAGRLRCGGRRQRAGHLQEG